MEDIIFKASNGFTIKQNGHDGSLAVTNAHGEMATSKWGGVATPDLDYTEALREFFVEHPGKFAPAAPKPRPFPIGTVFLDDSVGQPALYEKISFAGKGEWKATYDLLDSSILGGEQSASDWDNLFRYRLKAGEVRMIFGPDED